MSNSVRLRRQRSWFAFGSVALADILANSVVVILLLIVITLKIKEEQIASQRQQSHDINVLLSRQIATSVVMNDLPSSRPALLHDYNSCDIPHDCNPGLYPIIELRPTMVREYNSGITLTREQLLLETNQLDAFLVQLSPEVKRNIRIDVYGVELFYLAMDILKEHGVTPYHWHFLGENSPDAKGFYEGELISQLQQESEANLSAALGDLAATGFGESEAEAAAEMTESADLSSSSPEGASLRSPSRWRDSLLPPPWQQGSSLDQQISEELASGNSDSAEQQRIAQMTAEILGAMQSFQQQGQEQQSSFQLRLPLTNPEPQEGGESLGELDFSQLLLALLIYLDAAAELGLSNVSNQAVMQFALNHPDPSSLPQYARAEQIIANMQSHAPAAAFAIQRRADLAQAQAPVIALSVDKPIDRLLLREHPLVPAQANVGAAQVEELSVDLRLYPFADQGESRTIVANSLVLTPSSSSTRAQDDWLPVLILDPELQNNMVGYVYGQVDAGGLQLASAVNKARIDNLPIDYQLPSNPERGQLTLLSLYAVLLLAVLLGLLLWRHKKQRLESFA